MNENHSFSSSFSSRMTWQDRSYELSPSRYNLTIGAVLTWGFLVNYLLLQFVAPSIVRMMYTAPNRYSGFMIGFIIVYFVLSLMGNSMVRSTQVSKCFLGYNLIALPVGLLVALATIGYALDLVTRAALITAVVTLSMMIVSTLFPNLFSRIGPALGVSLLTVVVVELGASLIFRFAITAIDWVVVGIMSLYIGFDWARANAVQRTTTNAIAAASALYLDIINIFLRILRILARNQRRNN